MSREKFSIICPKTYTNKVQVIKALRCLTGMGLKEAKDASEVVGVEQVLELIDLSHMADPERYTEEHYRILRQENVQVGPPVHKLLEELRKLASQALIQGEDELASEILQLVLAEKLRRKP